MLRLNQPLAPEAFSVKGRPKKYPARPNQHRTAEITESIWPNSSSCIGGGIGGDGVSFSSPSLILLGVWVMCCGWRTTGPAPTIARRLQNSLGGWGVHRADVRNDFLGFAFYFASVTIVVAIATLEKGVGQVRYVFTAHLELKTACGESVSPQLQVQAGFASGRGRKKKGCSCSVMQHAAA